MKKLEEFSVLLLDFKKSITDFTKINGNDINITVAAIIQYADIYKGIIRDIPRIDEFVSDFNVWTNLITPERFKHLDMDEFKVATNNLLNSIDNVICEIEKLNNVSTTNNIMNVYDNYFDGINNSNINFNNNSYNNSDLLEILHQINGLVIQSGNQDAKKMFEDFKNELKKDKPEKSKLKIFWSNLTSILPNIKTISEITETIIKLIN